MIDLEADLDIFFSDFDNAATIQQPGLDDVPIRVLYSEPFKEALSGATIDPTATMKTSDLAGVDRKTAKLVIAGKGTFRIVTMQPDGAGLTLCTLEEIG